MVTECGRGGAPGLKRVSIDPSEGRIKWEYPTVSQASLALKGGVTDKQWG